MAITVLGARPSLACAFPTRYSHCLTYAVRRLRDAVKPPRRTPQPFVASIAIKDSRECMVCEGALLERHRPTRRLLLVPEKGEGVVKRSELGFGREEAP